MRFSVRPWHRPIPAGSARTGAAGRRLVPALLAILEAEQERWFLWVPVALGAGIALYFQLPFEPGPWACLLPFVAAVALRVALRTGLAGVVVGGSLVAFGAGIALAKLRTESVRAPVLARALPQAVVDGVVELVEPRAGKGQRLTIRVTGIAGVEPAALPRRVRVRTLAENASLTPGQTVRVTASLSLPPIPALPGDYDFARSAWYAGLGAVGYARAAAEIVDATPDMPPGLALLAAIERVRQAIGRRITAALPGETGAIANALVTGERGGISEPTNQAFRDSGLFHILSISGLHMAIIAGAAFLLIRVALAAVPALALRYPIKKWAAVGAMVATLGYLLISGSSFATVRSYVMISIMFLAVLLDRPAVALRNVALAALAILVVWPESLLDAGFQMSFAAVVALVSAYEWLRARREARVHPHGALLRAVGMLGAFVGGIVLTTLIASAAVTPFGLYHFHNTQAFAVLANLFAIPVCNFIVMPAALASLLFMPLGLEAGPLWIMGQGIEMMTWCATRVAGLPGSVGRVPAIPTAAFALVLAGGLWLTLWQTRWRLYGMLPILLGLALAPTGPRPDVLVGRNGGLVAVRTPAGTLSAVAERGSTFDLTRWLEHDGDATPAATSAKATAWRCDEAGCTARLVGLTLALAKHPSALRDDCAAAAILILRFAQTRPCASAQLLIDRPALARSGTHAIFVETTASRPAWLAWLLPASPTRLVVRAVADERGDRPWSRARTTPERAADAASMPRALRPEVADDDP